MGRWTEKDLQALLARGQVREVGVPAKITTVRPTLPQEGVSASHERKDTPVTILGHPDAQQGHAQEVQRHQGVSRPQEPILTQGSVRHASPGTSASMRQKRSMLAARVALQAWRARLATLASVLALCGACQQAMPHSCTLAGWRCAGCGAERTFPEITTGPAPGSLALA